MAQKPTKGLGRGLSSLLSDATPQPVPQNAQSTENGIKTVPIEQIYANPDQPRRRFDESKLAELAQSLTEKGVLQPLLVRARTSSAGEFQIVAGERRWRAAQRAGLHTLPVIVKDLDDATTLEIALIENVQRADLTAVEEAEGLQALMDQFSYTQDQLATVIGKSRPHIANTLRLLQSPEEIRDFVMTGALTAGHARALLTATDPVALAKKVVADGLSVRETEAAVRALNAKSHGDAAKSERRGSAAKDADTRALEADLSAQLGLKVSVAHNPKGHGELRLSYKTLEELDGLCQLLSR
ncbi:MAG: ParB/RepB/Spo0J family partition protein [Pseudomonadota bacterium]